MCGISHPHVASFRRTHNGKLFGRPEATQGVDVSDNTRNQQLLISPTGGATSQVEVYELFRAHPELLDVVEEGMTKEQHRELVRQCLRTIIGAGYSPMRYYVRDLRRYFYLAECTSLIDLSLVRAWDNNMFYTYTYIHTTHTNLPDGQDGCAVQSVGWQRDEPRDRAPSSKVF